MEKTQHCNTFEKGFDIMQAREEAARCLLCYDTPYSKACPCGTEEVAESTGKSVAIIGAGPAGLSCVTELAHKGHRVTAYEAHSEPGGILRYGLPDHRFPAEYIRQELQTIKNLA